eukprot:CAMPEP_0176126822 /NCGR_PEP_ID=MMETSP0120_2-20121206/64022_1 /TAXON_ID=160619 /ORGANISM="Kryptoperidinium foliaceum, Strain CCMP 1326" /LENGTH=89 /DNA_ID=CAMNT_0017461777 /DNA_START=15 /DNA_END=284 /DNA_ORIENTATION=-
MEDSVASRRAFETFLGNCGGDALGPKLKLRRSRRERGLVVALGAMNLKAVLKVLERHVAQAGEPSVEAAAAELTRQMRTIASGVGASSA